MNPDASDPADDPALLVLADELLARRVDATTAPLMVGIVGPVAVGKSTFAAAFARQLVDRADTTAPLAVEVVATDAFLLSNDRLAPLGGAMRKGYPESYDWDALDLFLAEAAAGAALLSTPLYSHETFDIVAGERHEFGRPDVLVVEGLNLLQAAPGGGSPADRLEHSVYLHAPMPLIEQWFVERLIGLARPEVGAPSDFYAMFAAMDDDQLDAVARWTWNEINAPNVRDHIEPTRQRADEVLHKGEDHRIVSVERRAG